MLIFRTRKKNMAWRNPSTWAEAVGKSNIKRVTLADETGLVCWIMESSSGEGGRWGVVDASIFLFRLFYLALLSDHVCVRANLCVRLVVQSRSPFFSLPPILFLGFHLPSLELPFDFGVTLHGETKKKWKRPWTLCHPQRSRSEMFLFFWGGGGFNFVFTGVDMPPQLVWV